LRESLWMCPASLKGATGTSLSTPRQLKITIWKCLGKWRYSSTIFDLGTRGKWVLVALSLGTDYSELIIQEAGWTAEPLWTLWNREILLAPARNRTESIHHVACRSTSNRNVYATNETRLYNLGLFLLAMLLYMNVVGLSIFNFVLSDGNCISTRISTKIFSNFWVQC
jgi:hypothetical protein